MTFLNFTRHVKGRIKDTNHLPRSLVLHVPCQATPDPATTPQTVAPRRGSFFWVISPFHLHVCWAGGLHMPPAPPELRTAGRAQWDVPQTAFLILGPGTTFPCHLPGCFCSWFCRPIYLCRRHPSENTNLRLRRQVRGEGVSALLWNECSKLVSEHFLSSHCFSECPPGPEIKELEQKQRLWELEGPGGPGHTPPGQVSRPSLEQVGM